LLIKAINDGNEEVVSGIAHGIYRIRFLSPSSLALQQKREEGDFSTIVPKVDYEALAQREKEFLEQMKKRLSIRKISKWLDEHGGKERILSSSELISDEESYIRFIYALLYGDSRNNFDYNIEENNEPKADSVKAADYVVPDIRLRRKSNVK